MVTIEQHVWGMTPEGEAIILYTLRNDRGAEVRLSNYGAAIVAAVMPDREGRMADVVLGYKHPEGYFFDGAASGKSVGRCANRIASGRMTIEGKEYSLEVNNGPNHLHGGTKNFANRLWESRVETNRVVMSLLSEDGDQNYHGELNVEAILGEVGELREKGSGRCVNILSSQPSVMVYTGNWLAGGCPETKTGGRYDDYDGVAIECQNYPDAVNHPDFPSPLLRPGELYCQKIVFRFGTF